jgi:polysaccharide export outer membrane protein
MSFKFMSVGRIARILSLATIIAIVSFGAQAQVSLTPEQMKAAQSLSPQQRQSIINSIESGQVSGGAATSGMGNDLQRPNQELQIPPAFLPAEEERGDDKLRIEGGETIVVTLTVDPEFEGSEELAALLLDVNRSRIVGSHAVQLDNRGVLDVPGVALIPLTGLSAEEIAIRLSSEPLLKPLDVEVTILPLVPTGVAALKPFGHSLFEDMAQSAFMQTQDNALVPSDYVIGPGDAINVQLYGDENYETTLSVNADGSINFPRTGPKIVAGLTFAELKEDIEHRVADQLIGTSVAITMARLRSIQIFVVGDVRRPGAYRLTSLSRITSALLMSGGITEIGSLRNVQLKRNGNIQRTLDLYDLLLHGDARDDVQLRSNDVVFVPPTDILVGIGGEIRRPAIYEFNSEVSVDELVKLAGGVLPTADRANLRMERVTTAGKREIETVDILSSEGLAMRVRSGDMIRVLPVIEEIGDGVFLEGHVKRPGAYEWNPGMRITDLLPTGKYLRSKADLAYVLIRRERGPDRQTEILSVNLAAAQASPKSPADLVLKNRDRLTVFEFGIGRSAKVQTILEELEAQATTDAPANVIKIIGNTRAPGSYPLEPGMRVSDLLRAGGGLSASAFPSAAELTRYSVDSNGQRTTQLITIDLEAVRTGDESKNIYLMPYDYLSIREVPEWKNQIEIILVGEVRFPGTYAARQGETLSSVIERAGGLSDQAFPEGGIFTRAILKDREAEQIEELIRRLESDLAALALRAANDPSSGFGAEQTASSQGQGMLETLRDTEPTGRLVIDLPRIISSTEDNDADLVLRDGDMLMIPLRAQEVTVLGEVQYGTSHFYDKDISRDGYIGLSGGMTVNADPKRVYVVHANGSVIAAHSSSRWFGRGKVRMHPGDTVVVPMDTDRLPSLTQWASITQIVYNLALAAAAVNSF